MGMAIRSTRGEVVKLAFQIASSGEATIWKTDRDGFLAKIYHDPPKKEQVEKLLVQIGNAPADPNRKLNHYSWAMPIDLLMDSKSVTPLTHGFLMPHVEGSVELINVYNALKRRKLGLGVTWQFLHATAMNLASIVAALHAKDYVVGDMKPKNILVNSRALPTLIDCDSMQTKDQNGKVYFCPVGSEGFTPPELLGKDLNATVQSECSDRFRLAVIIFLLLFGEHPFRVSDSSGEPVAVNDAIRKGMWRKNLGSSKRSIPFDCVHPKVQRLFSRCFDTGCERPQSRPSAKEWQGVLAIAFQELRACPLMPGHYFSAHRGQCSWCDCASRLNYDPFGSSANLVLNAESVKKLVELACNRTTATVRGKVSKISSNKDAIVLWMGKTAANSTVGAFRIVISKADLGTRMLLKIEKMVKQVIQVSGTLEVWGRGKVNYPQISLNSKEAIKRFLER